MGYYPRPVPEGYDELRHSISEKIPPEDSATALAIIAVLDRLEDLERRYAKHEHNYRTSRGTFDTSPPDPVWE